MAKNTIQSFYLPPSRLIKETAQVEGVISNKKHYEVAQRVFLGMATVCAVLSLIPPLRLGAAFALRGVSFLSTALPSKGQRGILPAATKAIKISAIALGIVGLAASVPILMIGSLAIDMGLQTAALVRSAIRKEPRAMVHLTLLVVDTLALLAFVFASWQFLFAAFPPRNRACRRSCDRAGRASQMAKTCLAKLKRPAA